MTVSALFAVDAEVLASFTEPADPGVKASGRRQDDAEPFLPLVAKRMSGKDTAEESLFETAAPGEATIAEPEEGEAPSLKRKPEERLAVRFAPEHFFPAAPLPVMASALPPVAAPPEERQGGTPDAVWGSLDAAGVLGGPPGSAPAPAGAAGLPDECGQVRFGHPAEIGKRPGCWDAAALRGRRNAGPMELEPPAHPPEREAVDAMRQMAPHQPAAGVGWAEEVTGAPESHSAPRSRPLSKAAPSQETSPAPTGSPVRQVPPPKEAAKPYVAAKQVEPEPPQENSVREELGAVEPAATAVREAPRRREAWQSGAPQQMVEPPRSGLESARAEMARADLPTRPRLEAHVRMEPDPVAAATPTPAPAIVQAPPRAVRIELPLGAEGLVRARIVATPDAVQVKLQATDPAIQAEIHRQAPQLQARLEEMQRAPEVARGSWEPAASEAGPAPDGMTPESFGAGGEEGGGPRRPLPEERDGGFGHRRQRRQTEQEEEDSR